MNAPTPSFGDVLGDLRRAIRSGRRIDGRHRNHTNSGCLSQAELAERAGFSHTYISRLEGGTRSPTRETVCLLAVALGATSEQHARLLFAAGFSPDDPDALIGDPLLRDLACLLKRGDISAATMDRCRLLVAQVVDLCTLIADTTAEARP